MTDLSKEDRMLIDAFPLEKALAPLRKNLQAVSNNSDTDPRDAISTLLASLLGHRVARNLRSRQSSGTVAGELSRVFGRFDTAELAVAAFQPLLEAVVRQTSDFEIWKQVLVLIASSSRLTPPPGASPSFGGTPRTHTSASHQGSEQTNRLLHDALRDELHDCSYVKVAGFFEKYFDGKSWTQNSKDVWSAVKHAHSDGRWTESPSRPTEDAVWNWWARFQDEQLKDQPGVYYRTKSKAEMDATDGERQVDLFIKSRHAPISEQHDWADVQVIGEHTTSKKRGPKFLQLATYARSVFSAQPRRKFVHAFILFETSIELHMFDRSGTFSAEPFDVHEQPERFIRVISGYCMMSEEELGLDTFIERNGGREYVTVADTNGKDMHLQLDPRRIVRRGEIAGRATSCYLTAEGQNVVKFSWISTSRSPTESELLQLANKKKVKGVPRLLGSRLADSTGELRSPLVFTGKRNLRGRQYATKRQQSSTSFSTQFASLPMPDGGRKRKLLDAESSSKQSRSNSQPSKLSQVREAETSFSQSHTSQGIQILDKPFIDRVLHIQATQPAGRPLAAFYGVRELLRALRDAIKAHRSLYLDGKILHRDISESNIIVTDPDKNEGLSGMLIDLELSTIIDDEGKNTRTGLKRITGTLKYMAIEVLQQGMSGARPDIEHTYRHDLESFFYVFLSMCVSHGWDQGKAPKEDPFRDWYATGSYESMVRAKLGDMGLDGFETLVLPRFSPAFKTMRSLATDLRDLLFLRLPGVLRLGTPKEDESILYDNMIAAFDKAQELFGN